MRTNNNASLASAFTLVEIMIVVAIIGLLASIAIPSFVTARTRAREVTCGANLRQISGAKEAWALRNRSGGSEIPSDDVLFGKGKFIKEKPDCPANGSYIIGTVDEEPSCTVHAPVSAEKKSEGLTTDGHE
jgi:prepilin-type N-terminal cleavage/methylation domain-containing protein